MAQEMEEQKQIKISRKIVKPVLLQLSDQQGIIRLTISNWPDLPKAKKKSLSLGSEIKRGPVYFAHTEGLKADEGVSRFISQNLNILVFKEVYGV